MSLEDRMVSFDVVSLFTRVPLDDSIEIIFQRLVEDETLETRSTILANETCSLIELCLRCTYFQFQDTFYEQLEGTAMGSPLSPIVANIFMESFESNALILFHVQPKQWVRYVDNTFIIWTHEDAELNSFHDHLNSIQFTKEEEVDGKIPFLDVLVVRKTGGISTTVYRKPTHTNRYIHYSSHHPPSVKSDV